eukprot:TRINITY_DN4925_c1_g1_i2.p1 TRINITY_DN4925_c1_g1~~TRINITY_DN4925_c1_g1_i2.p1  ORF type:complete len:209 (+),score=-16.22 TRINITY_DN4925_c1_g1_i2:172-798(+)
MVTLILVIVVVLAQISGSNNNTCTSHKNNIGSGMLVAVVIIIIILVLVVVSTNRSSCVFYLVLFLRLSFFVCMSVFAITNQLLTYTQKIDRHIVLKVKSHTLCIKNCMVVYEVEGPTLNVIILQVNVSIKRRSRILKPSLVVPFCIFYLDLLSQTVLFLVCLFVCLFVCLSVFAITNQLLAYLQNIARQTHIVPNLSPTLYVIILQVS